MAYQTINPYTNELEKSYENHDAKFIESTLTKADNLYHTWKIQKVSKRAETLHKVADLLVERKEELAAIITRDMGKRFF